MTGFSTRVDMAGKRFGRLVVTEVAGKNNGRLQWKCVCDCGAQHVTDGSLLRRGVTQSCGCLMRERVSARNFKHGHKSGGTYTSEYIAWQNIIGRCENPNHAAWHNYGGRGITMCAMWRESFEAFFADMGAKPSAARSIDRINNNGNHEPGNCRWTTWAVQMKNRRDRGRDEAGRYT